MKLTHWSLAALLALSSLTASAATMDEVADLQHTWANVNYNLQDDAQEKAFEALVKQADEVVSNNPEAAEVYIWRGIIESSFAGAKGGLGALSLAKAAKADFEKAMEINPNALNGSAYTSLGTLYSKVPGWPLGFGDDDKAKQLLEKAIAINPTGIDSNYFYASFLYDQGDIDKAESYLLKAKSAAPRPTRPVADQGRHKDIAKLLAKINESKEE